MNKRVINNEIQIAYETLSEVGIVKDNKVNKTFRGYVSTFGAAIVMGSLLPAIAFYNNKENDLRKKMLDAILEVLKRDGKAKEEKTLFDYAKKRINAGEEAACKEDIVNAAIAIKLAVNLYELVKN